jgi:glycosyltransferase involved in cell wall biosynthesis
MTTKISVVCPTYNSEGFIERTINSLLSQEMPPFEVVFSDDGSKDNTVALLEQNIQKFNNRGVKIQILKNRHQGPGETRNQGIEHAKGSWISFLDSDDIWLTNKIKRVMEAIEANPEINFIAHWYDYIRVDGRASILKKDTSIREGESLEKQVYKGCVFGTSAVTCKKDMLIKVGGFDGALPVGQDYELWLKLSPYLKYYIIKEVLGQYLEQETGISARPYFKRYWSLISILVRHRKKGGLYLLFYRVMRATITKQWYFSYKQIVFGMKGHGF